MNGNEQVWRRADLALQVALARGLSVGEAAQAAGVSESTVRRRRRNPEFRAQVQRRTEQLAAELVKLTATDLTAPQPRDTGHVVSAAQLSQTDARVPAEAPSPAPARAVSEQLPHHEGIQESPVTGSPAAAGPQPRRDGVAATPRPMALAVVPAAPRIGSATHEPPTAGRGELPRWIPFLAVTAGLVGLYIALNKIGATQYYEDYDKHP